MSTPPKQPESEAEPSEGEVPDVAERPEGMVPDAPATFDGDETEWAERAAREAEADNPALAKARARLAALARVKRA